MSDFELYKQNAMTEVRFGGCGAVDTENEDSDKPEDVLEVYICARCDHRKGELLERYRAVVKRLSELVDDFHRTGTYEMYHFQPTLVAKDVTAAILEELPTLVGDKHVKNVVEDGELWITNLSTCDAHGSGVSEINAQAGAWSNLLFDCATGAVISSGDGRSGSAPDLVIKVAVDQRQQGVAHACLVIIELEVSNRSIRQMRKDFLRYFQFDPSVYSVVAIKMLAGDRHTPCQSSLAVQWTRLPDGGVVEAVGCWDFGMLKISHSARTLFSEDRDDLDAALPPVTRASWAEQRHIPVPMTALPAVPNNAPNPYVSAAAARYISQLYAGHAAATLYGGVPPQVRFDANVLNLFRHNVPPMSWSFGTLFLTLGACSMWFSALRPSHKMCLSQ